MNGLPHLARRWWAALHPRALAPDEQAEVARLLKPEEAPLFWRQPATDQQHALACARAVLARAPGRGDLARAALLHDVGKAPARLRVAGRVLATTLSLLHLPAPGRLGMYLHHGPRGAEELARVGADPLIVAYARHHHGDRPPGINPHDWDLLVAVDQA